MSGSVKSFPDKCGRCGSLRYEWRELRCGHDLCADCFGRKKGKASACRLCHPPAEEGLKHWARHLRSRLEGLAPEDVALIGALDVDLVQSHLLQLARATADEDGVPQNPSLYREAPLDHSHQIQAARDARKAAEAAAQEDLDSSADSFETAADVSPRRRGLAQAALARPFGPDSVALGRGLVSQDAIRDAVRQAIPGHHHDRHLDRRSAKKSWPEEDKPNFRARVDTGGQPRHSAKGRRKAHCLHRSLASSDASSKTSSDSHDLPGPIINGPFPDPMPPLEPNLLPEPLMPQPHDGLEAPHPDDDPKLSPDDLW